MDRVFIVLKIVIVFVYGTILGCLSNVLIDYFVKKVENGEQNIKEKVEFNYKYLSYSCGCRRKGLKGLPVLGRKISKGICCTCNEKINKRYMLVELLMGVLFSVVVVFKTNLVENMLFLLVVFSIVTLSFVDLKTFEIPIELNYFILGIGVIYTAINYKVFYEHILGAIVISGFIAILIYASNGRAMGGGDCKLMFTCGLVLGWKLIIVAFMVGCILGSVIHIARIKISKEEKVLAFGPYLAMGIYIAYIWGDSILKMYMSLYK